MAKTIYIDRLLRLTLTRKGKAIAKHPYLREDVVEAVKASQIETDSPLWVACKATPEGESRTVFDEHDGAAGMARYQSGRWS